MKLENFPSCEHGSFPFARLACRRLASKVVDRAIRRWPRQSRECEVCINNRLISVPRGQTIRITNRYESAPDKTGKLPC